MPIVGIASVLVISAATSPGTISMTTANAPAASRACASASSRAPASAAALHPVAAEVVLGLRREADVGHHRDPGPGEQLDLAGHLGAALELDRVRVRLLHEPHGGVEGLLGRGLVGAEREVGHHHRAARRAGHGPHQRQQLVDGHRQRGLVAVDVVGGGVTDQEHRDAGLVEGGGGVHVVGGEHRPLLAALLHLAQVVGAHPLGGLGCVPAGAGAVRRGGLAHDVLAQRVLEAPGWSPRTAPQASPARRPRARAMLPGPRGGVWQTRTVDFDSVYDQGFARVAACTVPTTIADPRANAAAVLAQARRLRRGGGRGRAVPRARADRVRHRRPVPPGDRCSTRWRRRSPTWSRRRRELRAVLVVGAPLRHGNRLLNAAVVVHGGRVLGVAPEVLPADLPRVLRAPALRPRRRPPRRHHRRSAALPVPLGPDLLFAADRRARPGAARRGLRGHVGAGAAERRGRAGGRDGAAQPVRQPDHGGPRRGPAAAGALGVGALPRRVRSTPRRARASPAPTCPGTARRWSTRSATCWPRPSASRTGRAARWPTST